VGPKDVIIQTALDIIGQEGVHKITTREIAKRANVNTAALNYHFGTKDRLVEQAMGVFIRELAGTYAELEREELPMEERLLSFLQQFAAFSVRYPGVTKSLVDRMMWAEAGDPALAAAQRKGIERLTGALAIATGRTEPAELRAAALQLMSGVLYPVLLHKQLPDLYGIDYAKAEEREAYVERLYRRYVPGRH